MRVAIIDLGTNSVRFDVHQLGPGRRAHQLHREKLMIRLGQGVFLDGRLDREAVNRALEAFASFKRTAADLHVDRVVAFGTSALREAADGERLLGLIRKRTGIEVRVITGGDEARLIAIGILQHERIPKGRFALLDIGGGSTEVSVCRGKDLLLSDSFALGAARLQQVFLRSSPPRPTPADPNPIDHLRRYIKSVILPKILADDWPRVERILGSSGTIRAIARTLRKKGGGAFDRGELRKLVKAMSGMTTTQLLGLPGMEPRRVDMILAGAILLEECMDALGAKKVSPTEFSLRDGILEEQLRLLSRQKRSPVAFHLGDLSTKARKLGAHETHFKQVAALSEALFHRLARLHRLHPRWRIYLTAAATLHDVGEGISPTRHEEHSYYIVKNSDFPAMEPWETDFIAELCLLHRGGKVDPGLFKEKARRLAFLKLLALLRVADSLDRGHKAATVIRAVRIRRRKVELVVTGRGSIDLECLRAEQKKGLFEDVFGRELVIVKVSQAGVRPPRSS